MPRISDLKHMMKLIAVALCATMLAACANSAKTLGGGDASSSVSHNSDSLVELNPDQVHVESDAELASDPELPALDLTSETLAGLLVANLASYQGKWSLAATRAQQVAMVTRDYRVARLATLLALRDNDYQKGLHSAELWYELDSDSADPLNMLLITQLGSGDAEGVKVSIANHAKGKNLDSHIKQIAALLIRQKNKDEAIKAASHMVENYDRSAQAALSSAFVAEFFAEFELSEQWVIKALTLRPGWDLAAQMQAKLLASQGKIEERGKFIAEYAEQHPESITMQINLAAEMVRKGKVDEAYDFIQRILEADPRNVDALQYAGALAEDQKDFASASRFYQRALNIEPSNDDIRWSLARRKLIDKKFASAARHFGDIRDPELLFSAQIQVANARYELNGLDSALATLATLEPNTEAEYVNLALSRHYLLMGEYQYEEALGAISEVLYYLPEDQDLIYARALVAAELKRLDIAEPDLRAIINAKPDHANALNALGYTLADQTDRLDEARELIEKALALRPNDAHILDSMGWVAYRQNDFELAIEFLEKAYAASEEVEIATHLGEVLWESGQQERAKNIWTSWALKEADNKLLSSTMQRYGLDVNNVDATPPESDS